MPASRKRATKSPKAPYRVRPCRLCKAKFKPTTKVISCADSQEFCCPAHRKEYWKYGGLPYDKMIKRIEGRTRGLRDEIVESLTEVMQSIAKQEIASFFEDFKKELHLYAVSPSSPQSV